MITRRGFLTHSCAMGVAAATVSSTLLSLGFARTAAAQSAPGYRALVCILLAGGNDSYNMLVPVDTDQYGEYAAIRTDLALQQSDLLALPDHVFPVAGLALGWPAEPTKVSKRLPLSVTLHEDRYDPGPLRETVEAYDRTRAAAQPYERQRYVEDFGAAIWGALGLAVMNYLVGMMLG